MIFRGKPLSEVCRLYIGLVLMLVAGTGILAAETAVPKMARHTSRLHYSLDYPQDWFKIDRSNTTAARSELAFARADSNSLSDTFAKFLLAQIDSLEIKAAFIETPGSETSAVITVHLGPYIDRFDGPARDLVETRFRVMLLPPVEEVKLLNTRIVRNRLKKTLALTASTTEPGRMESIHYHCLTANGKGRSFTFILRGNEADVQRLEPVLESMATSLKDDFEIERGISRLPRWAEVALIILFSLSISWLIIRLRSTRQVFSRRKRRRSISFFELFLLVSAVLVIISYLLTSCQSARL